MASTSRLDRVLFYGCLYGGIFALALVAGAALAQS